MFLLGMLGITTGSCDVLIGSVKDMSDYRLLYVLCYHAERRGTEEDDECAGPLVRKYEYVTKFLSHSQVGLEIVMRQ
jgi:hypothetical protein